MSAVERVWYGDGPAAIAARIALAPLSMLFRGATSLRNAAYDARVLGVREPAVPCVSVGNLSVGGTGKTPVTAWVAQWLASHGATPAIVLRGYGDDEPAVHARLNPDLPVIASADRVAGVAQASARGANVVVLDDAFQHRRIARVADLVLVSADRWSGDTRVLPAGPWRESLAALERATIAIVTRKSASAARAGDVIDALRRARRDIPFATMHLAAGELRTADESRAQPLTAIAGQRVLAVAAVGDPRAFAEQLTQAGATVMLDPFPDHHAYSASDIARLAARAESVDSIVCTLKDAVKLAPRWPRAAPTLWYVSQRIFVEQGGALLDDILGGVARRVAAGVVDSAG